MVEHLERLFPSLRGTDYQVTSPPDEAYNCAAWAAGQTTTPWWPAAPDISYWPSGVPREETLQAFSAAFATLGYALCSGAELEPGFEKVAFFAIQGTPTHAARQLPSGRWTSKLGIREDIEHELHALSGAAYGKVALLLKRPLAE